jgi:hypothetical protein
LYSFSSFFLLFFPGAISMSTATSAICSSIAKHSGFPTRWGLFRPCGSSSRRVPIHSSSFSLAASYYFYVFG